MKGQNNRMKKYSRTSFELLFAYLFVTKVIYWINLTAGLQGVHQFGAVVLDRFIGQDIFVIAAIAALYIFEKKIGSMSDKNNSIYWHLTFYIVCYVIATTIFVAYINFMIRFVYTEVTIDWFNYIFSWSMSFIVIMAAAEIKDRFKKKGEADIKIGKTHEMLETLCKDGIISDDEFEQMKKRVEITPA